MKETSTETLSDSNISVVVELGFEPSRLQNHSYETHRQRHGSRECMRQIWQAWLAMPESWAPFSAHSDFSR
jgi:hypothetical protein